MRALYAQRQAEVVSEVTRELAGAVDIDTADNGLHLVGWLKSNLDDQVLARAAAGEGVDVWPLSLHTMRGDIPPAVLLGYANLSSHDIRCGVAGLARAVHRVSARRRGCLSLDEASSSNIGESVIDQLRSE
jgi:GntR family transcriptional regulator/MocR family aminotransferase